MCYTGPRIVSLKYSDFKMLFSNRNVMKARRSYFKLQVCLVLKDIDSVWHLKATKPLAYNEYLFDFNKTSFFQLHLFFSYCVFSFRYYISVMIAYLITYILVFCFVPCFQFFIFLMIKNCLWLCYKHVLYCIFQACAILYISITPLNWLILTESA
jgi:hypothetical protein